MGPSTLVAPFCCHEALVEPLSLFITDSSKVLWKLVQTTEHEVHFDQGCGVGNPVIRLLAISIIRLQLRPSAVLVT